MKVASFDPPSVVVFHQGGWGVVDPAKGDAERSRQPSSAFSSCRCSYSEDGLIWFRAVLFAPSLASFPFPHSLSVTQKKPTPPSAPLSPIVHKHSCFFLPPLLFFFFPHLHFPAQKARPSAGTYGQISVDAILQLPLETATNPLHPPSILFSLSIHPWEPTPPSLLSISWSFFSPP